MINENIKHCPKCGEELFFVLVEEYEDWYDCNKCKKGYVIREHGYSKK